MALSADAVLNNRLAKWVLVFIVVMTVLGFLRRVF